MRRSPARFGVPILLLAGSLVSAAPTPGNGDATPTRVELVFVLDTTGSMAGMITESKRKIWSVVRELGEVEPALELRLGFVAFRDRGDEYVTKRVPLTRGIDAAYVELMGLEADGGGDEPESVNEALREALSRIDWSEDPGTLRAIFLVGDAPPHLDYAGDVPYGQSCASAARRGIRISTIQCGDDPVTRKVWNEIASCARGDSFVIDRPGSSEEIKTPFDRQLALHARLLDGTILSYGTEEQRAAVRRRLEAGRSIDADAPDEAKAERARFNAAADRLVEEGDLVEDVRRGTTDLAALPEASLPEALERMPAEQRRKYVEGLAEQRRGLRSEIEWFARQRERYIETHYGRREESFDRRVVRSLLHPPRPEAERWAGARP